MQQRLAPCRRGALPNTYNVRIDGIYFQTHLARQYSLGQFLQRFWHLWPAADAHTREQKLTTAYQILQLYAHPA